MAWNMPGYILYCKLKKPHGNRILTNQLRMHAFKNGLNFCTIETKDVKSVFHIAFTKIVFLYYFECNLQLSTKLLIINNFDN